MILEDLLILKPIPQEDLKIGKIFYQKSPSIIFGYGAICDRFLINQTASNGILYALISSGISGFLFFTFFTFIFLDYIKEFFE